MGNHYQSNYPRNPNPRFYYQSEQASESALVETNIDETEKLSGSTGEPPIILNLPDENSLSSQMLKLYESLLPTLDSYEKRQAFACKIEEILNNEWPGKNIKVHMFGSSKNELGTAESDVDLCVTTEWNGLEDIFVLSECLKKHGMKIEQTVSKAKVPIVRLSDPSLNLACDINVNNTLALHNTRLIRTYVSIDPRVRPLAMIVKHWARRRVLNDAAKGGTISTYTWTCIILNFLQMRNPPILPVLHKIPHEGVEPIIVNDEDASFCEDVESLKTFGQENKESLGGLLFAFFRRMAFEFDYNNHVISLRQGKYLTKAEKGWDTCKGWKMLCVEEPFNTARNLGNSADDVSVGGLKQEFERAYNILCESANLDSLCEKYYVQHFYIKNYNNNTRVFKNGTNKRGFRINNGHVKSGNRYPCTKLHNGQQNEQTNYTYTTDNFHDMNGKSNYSQNNEEDRRFHVNNVTSLRQNNHYSTFNGTGVAPVSESMHVDHVRRDYNNYSTRKQNDDYQNRRERNNFPSTTRHAEVNNSQNQHHNMSFDLKEDEQLFYNHPQTKNAKNSYFHRQGFTKRKNDERSSYSDQPNNNGRVSAQSQDSDLSAYKSQDTNYTNSNQNLSFYKNNNQKVESNWGRPRFSHPDQKSNYSQNVNGYHSRRQNTSSDSDQKAVVTHNNYHRQKSSLNKQEYNSRQVEDSNSVSIVPSRSKLNSNISDDSSNFDRSNNPVQMSSPKPAYKSNNYNKNNNSRQHQFNSKSIQQFQKPVENYDFTNNNNYSSYHNGSFTMPMSNDLYSANHNNGYLSPQNSSMFIHSQQQHFQNHHGQPNDGTANYPRRNSHQSSSDGSNSQTSGNTSNTSVSNSSDHTKHSYQKNNNNQNNYHQQQRPNKSNNGFRKRKNNNNSNNNNNNNYVNGNNGYNNSGNGNFRSNNNTSNNSSPVIVPNVNDPAFNKCHEGSIITSINAPSQMNQGHYSMSRVSNDYNGDTNVHKAYNKGYNNNNNNNSNNWKNLNGHNNTNPKIISNHTNVPRSANSGDGSFNRNVNSGNLNTNYLRSNGSNYSNNNSNYNANKFVNGNNQNVYKSVDVNNNSNVQTKSVNNNNHSNSIKNGGNNSNGNVNGQRNYKNGRGNKNARKNSNANLKADKKEDCFHYQQQYSQEFQLSSSQEQNHHNIQSHQQNNNYQQEGGSKSKTAQKKKFGNKRNSNKELQQQQPS